MKNKFIKSALLVLPLLFSSLFASSCDKENTKNREWTYNYDNFFGMCELTGEMSNGVDYALTHNAVANKAKIMGVKSFRIWISIKDLFFVDDDDELTINQSSYAVMKDHVGKLYDAGVRNFNFMYTTFIYPKDYVPSTGYVVPDPNSEYNTYIRFLNLIGKASALIAENFPECTIIEPGNEPDFQNSSCVHKNGYIFGGSISVNNQYLFTDDDKASILDDMCWYTKKYLKDSGHGDVKVAIPGLTNLDTAPDFLDLMYDRIESKCLPAGQEKSDTNVDNYFDYLNWHPYTHSNTEKCDEEWVEFQKEMYQAAVDHGDDGRPVIFTEFGSSDFGLQQAASPAVFDKTQNFIAEIYLSGFKAIKENFPQVEAVFCFRMFNLVHQDVSPGENNFGIFYSPDDPFTPSKAKPAAIAIAKYFNGDNFDVSVLDSHVK